MGSVGMRRKELVGVEGIEWVGEFVKLAVE